MAEPGSEELPLLSGELFLSYTAVRRLSPSFSVCLSLFPALSVFPSLSPLFLSLSDSISWCLFPYPPYKFPLAEMEASILPSSTPAPSGSHHLPSLCVTRTSSCFSSHRPAGFGVQAPRF